MARARQSTISGECSPQSPTIMGRARASSLSCQANVYSRPVWPNTTLTSRLVARVHRKSVISICDSLMRSMRHLIFPGPIVASAKKRRHYIAINTGHDLSPGQTMFGGFFCFESARCTANRRHALKSEPYSARGLPCGRSPHCGRVDQHGDEAAGDAGEACPHPIVCSCSSPSYRAIPARKLCSTAARSSGVITASR